MSALHHGHHVQVVWGFAAFHWGTRAGQAIMYQVPIFCILFLLFLVYARYCSQIRRLEGSGCKGSAIAEYSWQTHFSKFSCQNS